MSKINSTQKIKYDYEIGGQVQGQRWPRKMCGKPADRRVK